MIPVVPDAAARSLARALGDAPLVRVLRAGPGEGRSSALQSLAALLRPRFTVREVRCAPGVPVFAALHGVCGEQVVLLVDDAQHADVRSAGLLARWAASLPPSLSGLVLTAPSGAALPAGLAGIPSTPLAGLPDEHLRALLGADVPDAVAERILLLFRRHPMGLREAAAALTPGQLRGWAPLPSRPPLGPESLRVLTRSLTGLPDATRGLLLRLALANGDLGLLAATNAGLDELRPAQDAGMVSIGPAGCRWNPPLLPDAVLQSAPAADTVAAGRELVAACGAAAGPLRRAVLIARTAVGPAGAELHSAVVALAGAGQLVQAHEAATAAIDRAAGPRLRARFRISTAELAWLAGYPKHALDVLAAREPDEPEDGSAQVLRWAAASTGDGRPPGEPFTARPGDEPSLAARMIGTALVAGWETAPPADLADLALGLGRLDRPGPVPSAAGATALHRVARGRTTLDAAESDALLALSWWLQPSDALHPKFWPPALLPVFLGEEARYERQFTDLLDTPFARAAPVARAILLGKRACSRWAAGRWAGAIEDARAGAELAQHIGQPGLRVQAERVIALVRAARGEDPGPVPGPAPILAWIRALTALGAARPDVACDELAGLHAGPDLSPQHVLVCRMSTVDFTTAAVRSAQPGLARPVVAAFAEWAEDGAASWVHLDLARCRAMLAGPEPGAAEHYEAALTLADEVGRPAVEASTRLAYGAWLRRAKHKRAARAQLRAAGSAFTALGATGWARRAEDGLRATGDPAVATTYSHQVGALTGQERRIADLAAQGLSNKEIAATLALSHRTVGYHLHKVFAKLGITTRAQLAHSLRP